MMSGNLGQENNNISQRSFEQGTWANNNGNSFVQSSPSYTFEQSPAFPGYAPPQQPGQAQQTEQNALVPYRGNMQQVPFMGQGSTQQMVPGAFGALGIQLAPSPQHTDEPSIVYVPPMYTKPRPIIPRYRVISGLLSVLIVMALLCTGAGYYAKVSGKLDMVRQFITGTTPNSVQPTATTIPIDPGTQLNSTSAASITISSSALTTHLSTTKNSVFVIKTDSVFKVNQNFYLIYSVQNPKTKGIVSLKWYTNCQGKNFQNCMFFTETVSGTVAANPSGYYDGKVVMHYDIPTQGKVELYWNNQLAQTLYFAVRS